MILGFSGGILGFWEYVGFDNINKAEIQVQKIFVILRIRYL